MENLQNATETVNRRRFGKMSQNSTTEALTKAGFGIGSWN